MKKVIKLFKKSKGFTLIEMLVVVLIIGILAAIALPQYKLAVGKARFATLKDITKSLSGSVNRYYLTHDAYPASYKELDLDFSVNSGSGTVFTPTTGNIAYCAYWADNQQIVACFQNIYGKQIGYYAKQDNGRPFMCYTTSTDENHITNRICKQDAGERNKFCNSKICKYYY